PPAAPPPAHSPVPAALPHRPAGPRLPTPPSPPLGLYLHIPFCVRKCHYCDFNAGPAGGAARQVYVEALAREIRQSPHAGAAARTVFFGGGTPSELSTPQLATILPAPREGLAIAADAAGA